MIEPARASGNVGNGAPGHQLPCAGGREIEAGGGVSAPAYFRNREADKPERDDRAELRLPAVAPDARKNERKGKIELFLDAEAPGMQERLEAACQVPIAGRQGKQDIVGEEQRRDDALAEVFQKFREHQPSREGDAAGNHQHQRGQDAPGAALVELQNTIPSLANFAHQNRGDEIPGDDEEHIDPEKAARNEWNFSVGEDHR